MNKNIIHKIYERHYRQQMNEEEYERSVDDGIELLQNDTNPVSYHSEHFKDLLLAIEYCNELLFDMLDNRSVNTATA